MAQPYAQASFNSGEWSPNLYARVDIEKYHSGAALLRNFFVDYRGGASTRFGTKYILRCFKDTTAVRIIDFEVTFEDTWVLEFGDEYMRAFKDGVPVFDETANITGATKANPCVVTVTSTAVVGDWVYISGVGGMTQLNGKYYIVAANSGTTITLHDLFGANVNSTGYGTYTAGGTTKKIFVLDTPYIAADLALLKVAQNVDQMIIVHPDYAPAELQVLGSGLFSIADIVFGTTIGTPGGLGVSTTFGAGTTCYSYLVTAVDANGQESAKSATAPLNSKQNQATVVGTNTITWVGVAGAVSYNVYKANTTITNAVPAGVPYGFIGNVTGTVMTDTNIAADFSQGPPIVQTPFSTGFGVGTITVTAGGSYTTVPTWTIAAPPAGTTATAHSVMGALSVAITNAGLFYNVGDILTFTGGLVLTVATVAGGNITSVTITSPGSYLTIPANPVSPAAQTGGGNSATFTVTYTVTSVVVDIRGDGYVTAPAITVSAGAATATTVIAALGAGNPSVVAFFQGRLCFGATLSAPQTIWMSQPGNYFNFNTSFPVQDDDAITAPIISGQLNTIKSMVPQPSGLLLLTDNPSYLVNGGSLGSAVTPASVVANPQSFNGANDVPPIISVYDVLYVQSKGSAVRDSKYNFYSNVFTGTDISLISSQLFYGYTIQEWAWAEEPYKIVWAVRNDGTLLSLTFMQEQEFIGWAHSDTQGSFKSVCSLVEQIAIGSVNAVYLVVERTVNSQTVKYIERMADRLMPNGVIDAWCVDSGLQYDGAPATTFMGGEHLAGKTVTGLRDGLVIPPFVMPANGTFTLAASSKVTIGLAFTPQLQTLYFDVSQGQQGTVQSKQKKINAVTGRFAETLGLWSGTDFNNLVAMKDLVVGNVGSMTNEVVTDLVSGDARVFLDPKWAEQGQYCFSQPSPFPASILGVFPQVSIGDTPK